VAYIKMGGADILKGYIDNVNHAVSRALATWDHLLRVSGRDYSQDLSNLFISKVWASAKKADDILDEALDRANSEITYASPSSASTIGGYAAHQQFLLDLFKTVLDRANMEAYVDTNKALQAFNIGAIASGITLTYSDLVGGITLTYSDLVGTIEYPEKAGLGIRNQIHGLGEFVTNSTADEITEPAGSPPAGWTTNGTATRSNVNVQEGLWTVRATKGGGGPVGVTLIHDLDWALDPTEGKFHFWVWAWATSGGGNVVVDDASLQLREDTSNYFTYDFVPADIGPDMVDFTEYDLDIGRDHEGNFSMTGHPDWSSINSMRFYAATVAETDVYMEVDGIGTHHMNYGGYANDSTSRTNYRKRMELHQDSQLSTHAETLDLADSILEKKKDPLEHITLTVKGSSCISGGSFKLWPGYKVTLNFPKLGISSEVWRVETAELKCFPHKDLSGFGHDFTAKLDCVTQSIKINHLDYAVMSRPRSITPHLLRESYKRRSDSKWLP